MLLLQIWSALESSAYLRASQLFLLARHINTGLQRDSQQAAKIATYFPVLARQWAAIGHFRTTILQVSDTMEIIGIITDMGKRILSMCSTKRVIHSELYSLFILVKT